MNKNILEEWDLYEKGVTYNQAIINGDKSYYDQVDVNIAFANGDQWRNVDADEVSKPVIPIIQKAKQHTIANVTSTSISATIQPLEYSNNKEERTPEMTQAIETTEIANAEIRNIFDETKFEFKVREGLGDAFDMGDMCLHTYWDKDSSVLKGGKYSNYKGRICAELIDGTNIMFGNANNPDPQIQPYILVIGRDLVINLQEEATKYKQNETINADTEWQYQAGDNGKVEIESDKYGKALYIIKYWKDKETNTIHATKCTKFAYMYKDIDLELNRYPIAWMNYKKQKNQYHGRAGCTGLIPNQIAINKLLAMIVYSVMKTAFPTMVYDADKMSAPTNEIGKAIGLHGLQPGESVRNLAGYLEVGQISNQVTTIINMIIDYTKDMLGINDAAVGNVSPNNTSAMALAEKLTSVPLENLRSNLYEFTEQFVDNLLDMIGTKYGIRPVVVKNGEDTQIVEFDFSKLKDLNTNKRIDVGAIGYSSELSSLKELKDLLNTGAITVIDYLERLPEYTIPKVKELVEEIKARMGYADAKEQQDKSKQYEEMAQFMETLPQQTQDELKKLPDDQLEQALMQLMKQAPNNQEINQQEEINNMIRGGQVEQ
jgi:hypothetical protein